MHKDLFDLLCWLFFGNRYFVIVLCKILLCTLSKFFFFFFFTICQTTNISESVHLYRKRYMMGDASFPNAEANVSRAQISHLVSH